MKKKPIFKVYENLGKTILLDELARGLMRLRNKISFKYYEMSENMPMDEVLKELDKIIKKIKY
jgi:hypothetical protein